MKTSGHTAIHRIISYLPVLSWTCHQWFYQMIRLPMTSVLWTVHCPVLNPLLTWPVGIIWPRWLHPPPWNGLRTWLTENHVFSFFFFKDVSSSASFVPFVCHILKYEFPVLSLWFFLLHLYLPLGDSIQSYGFKRHL